MVFFYLNLVRFLSLLESEFDFYEPFHLGSMLLHNIPSKLSKGGNYAPVSDLLVEKLWTRKAETLGFTATHDRCREPSHPLDAFFKNHSHTHIEMRFYMTMECPDTWVIRSKP